MNKLSIINVQAILNAIKNNGENTNNFKLNNIKKYLFYNFHNFIHHQSHTLEVISHNQTLFYANFRL